MALNQGSTNGTAGEVAPIESEKCYFSTAMREFSLTKHQIECAIRDGILDVLEVRNPHHKSGPPARMLYRAEIRQTLPRILAYPKFSAEEKSRLKLKRLMSSARARARDEVEFFCDTCQSSVRAPSGYPPFESYCEGKISRERLMKLLRRYHARHWHTDFEKVRKSRFVHNVRKGMELVDAAREAEKYARRMVHEEH